MLKTSDTIATTKQRATTADALAGLKKIVTVTNADEAFALALEEACIQGGIDFAFAFAHACNEADWLRDPDYVRDNNGWGIGHPDNASGGIVFESKRAGARFYVCELLLKMRIDIPFSLKDGPSYAPNKWQQVKSIVGGSNGPFPNVRTISDLNARFGPNNREATWMTDPNGPEAIVAKGNALFPGLKDQEDPTDMPELKPWKHHYYRRIMPVGQGRPNQKLRLDPGGRGGLIIVVHETANPTSTARSEADWMVNTGAVSPHLVIDQTTLAQVVPLDSVGWHAGDGCNELTDDGCFRGVAIETVVNTAQNWDVIRWNLAEVIARIALGDPMFDWGDGRTRGKFSIERIVQHNEVSDERKNCPAQMRREGFWPELMRRVDVKFAEIQAGTPTTTTTAPPSPFPTKRIPAPELIESQGHRLLINNPNRFGAIQGQTIRTAPSKDAPAGTKTPIKAGRRYTLEYRTADEIDGEVWYVSKAGSWVMADGFKV